MEGESPWHLALDDGAVLRGFVRQGSSRRIGVFIHGFRSHCDGGKSRGLSALAAANGYRWLRFDQRGCGASTGQFRRFTITRAVNDIERLLESLGEPRCVLVGSSLGALIAIHAASSGRCHVDGLVLIAPALRFAEHFLREQLADRELELWRRRGYRWFPDLYAGGCFRLDYGFCADALRYDFPPGKLPCPVLVIHGDRDELLPLDDSRQWVDRLDCPSRGLEIIEGGDHRLTQWTDLIARRTETLWNETT